MIAEYLSLIALTLQPGLNVLKTRRLLEFFGNGTKIFENFNQSNPLINLQERYKKDIIERRYFKEAEKIYSACRDQNIQPVLITSADYPEMLRECPDSPVVLYYKGIPLEHGQHILGVVGTRNPTAKGLEFCNELVSNLPNEVQIISGLARGIDATSHISALESGKTTFSVLAHGLDNVYPQKHRRLFDRILENGGHWSEYPPGILPQVGYFPARNRILAGLSSAVLVVESPAKGGSMITARLAHDYNRDVMALPGRPEDFRRIGCNLLIKQHIAHMIENVKDVCDILQINHFEKQESQEKIVLEPDEKYTLEAINGGSIHLDDLAIKLKKPVHSILPLLTCMQLKGVLQILPGNMVTSGY